MTQWCKILPGIVLCGAVIAMGGRLSAQILPEAGIPVNTSVEATDDRLGPDQTIMVQFAGMKDAVVLCRIGPSGAISLPTVSGTVYVRVAGLDCYQAASHIAESVGLDPVSGLVIVTAISKKPHLPELRRAFGAPVRFGDDTAIVSVHTERDATAGAQPDVVIVNDQWCLTPLIYGRRANPLEDTILLAAVAAEFIADSQPRRTIYETGSSQHPRDAARQQTVSEVHTTAKPAADVHPAPAAHPAADNRSEPARSGSGSGRTDAPSTNQDRGRKRISDQDN
jgi:hypothetical protein